eukprot:CAMPEP_0184340710 /NCGR_PEP_ID=MMETSP1089-20130417/9358_1 /TAXON_ID=38269 ORGANISM="Gloeochaete wittrockiana, Strain SAG46.84" /NCGR_SAMPLE_ID=MMETSP1089 /ASSEMBLY_ACC=CAM_ASM_000445 /LENGTH=405 /DNA_ID=CAMNT_0026668637 /DNA_START=11 /DNA_END=1228 /DNA_ORIENTATION=+
MKTLSITVFVWAALFCAFASAASNIWPQQVAFVPENNAEGWDNLDNSATDLIADVVFDAHPYVVTPDNIGDASPKQVGNWGFSLTSDGFIPSVDIEDEDVEYYIYDIDLALLRDWKSSGSGKTDNDGEFDGEINELPSIGNVYPTLQLLTAKNYFGRSAIWRFLPGTNAVVFDVDGTITTSDFQALCTSTQVCTANIWEDAQNAVQAWYDKGYQIVYLSGRPATMYTLTVQFLIDNNFPPGLLRCANDLDQAINDVEDYKTEYLALLASAGLSIQYVYGNAVTDIAAYERAGFSKNNTFIIGPNGGDDDTVDLGESYSDHLSFISSAPIALIPGIRLSGDIGPITNDDSSNSSNNSNSNDTNSKSTNPLTLSDVIPVTDSNTNSGADSLLPSLAFFASLFLALFF